MLNFKQLLKLLEFIDLFLICQRNDQTQAQSKSRVFRQIHEEEKKKNQRQTNQTTKKTPNQTFPGYLKKPKAYLHGFQNKMLKAS